MRVILLAKTVLEDMNGKGAEEERVDWKGEISTRGRQEG